MKKRIIKSITTTLKQIKSDATIYLDSVLQSDKDFYFVLVVESSGTENVGINVQNKTFLVDIALVNSKKKKEIDKLIEDLVEQCGSFFNVLNIDGNDLFPQDYQDFETDGVQHINFTVAFPQQIEWSEE